MRFSVPGNPPRQSIRTTNKAFPLKLLNSFKAQGLRASQLKITTPRLRRLGVALVFGGFFPVLAAPDFFLRVRHKVLQILEMIKHATRRCDMRSLQVMLPVVQKHITIELEQWKL
jgi:hypothetical protein